MTVPKIKNKKVLIIGIIAIFILSIVLSYFIVLKIGENRLRNQLSNGDDVFGSYDTDEADAYYNGKAYYYNKDLVNILCIGVDKENLKEKSDHQADAIYLVSADIKNKKAKIIAVSRNTMTDIDVYDMNGDFLATDYKQICLSYVYGSDDEQSSLLTQKAVSRLLYDLPINGYYTIFLDSIADIVDSVGGVQVTIPEDMTQMNKAWTKGANVTITGKTAIKYVIYRKGISEVRLQRQKQFIKNFISAAKKAISKDISLPFDMYDKLSKNTVTDVDSSSAVYLASKLGKLEFEILQIPGEVGFDGTYETFEVDETALYELVLNTFYKAEK